MSSMLGNRNITTLIIGLLSAVKLILQAFGVDIINSTEINQIADGVAALCTIVAVFMKHEKHRSASSTGSPDTHNESAVVSADSSK